jgi:pyruvate,water dikinase
MGLKNVVVMVPFCRTVEELKKVKAVMDEYGLKRGKEGLELFLMAEVPSNIILAEEFSQVHRWILHRQQRPHPAHARPGPRQLPCRAHLRRTQRGREGHAAHAHHQRQEDRSTKVGICGQGPSDFPDFAQFLVELGIDSISVTPDSLLKTKRAISGGGSEHGNERQGHGLSKLYDRAGTPGSPGRSACIVPSGSGNFSTRSLSHRSPGTNAVQKSMLR